MVLRSVEVCYVKRSWYFKKMLFFQKKVIDWPQNNLVAFFKDE